MRHSNVLPTTRATALAALFKGATRTTASDRVGELNYNDGPTSARLDVRFSWNGRLRVCVFASGCVLR